MRTIYLAVSLLFTCSVAVSQSAPAQPQGRIIGTVVNDTNEPIAGATLCRTVARPNSATTSCGDAKTDEQGHFDMGVPFEVNRVSAQSPQNGYPGMARPLEEGVRVRLSEQEPIAHVTIKIGPRPAELILNVSDGSTGKPVGSYIVRWLRIDDGPVQQTDVASKNRVLVPPNVDVLLIVRAHGYEPWFYSDTSNPSRPTLRLTSGEQRTISVQLQPQ